MAILGVPMPTAILYPAILFIGIPLTIFLLWLTRKTFIKDNPRFDDAASIKRRRKLRWTVFVLRAVVMWLLILSLATPLAIQNTVRSGDAHITVLIDNSSSMGVLDTGVSEDLIATLREQVPVSVYTIGSGETSNLGEGILSYLKPNENILLITDGNNNEGPALLDVASFAAQSNSTISAIRLSPREFDAAVTIEAPEKAIADTNTTIGVVLSRTEEKSVHLRILIDDIEVFNDDTNEEIIPITRMFAAGKHKVTAIVDDGDAIAQNNRYDFLLSVVEKPKVLVVSTRQTGLHTILSQLYSVTTLTSVPTTADALKPYYAIVLIDVPASSVAPATQSLTQYLLDGNGLLVAGGQASYDYGDYKNSPFESLLPVTVGKGDPKGGANIVIALDLSGSAKGGLVRDRSVTSNPYPICYDVNGKQQCFRSLKEAPVTCLGGTITQDEYNEEAPEIPRHVIEAAKERGEDPYATVDLRKTRDITCEQGAANNIKISALDNGESYTITLQLVTGTLVSNVCLGPVCMWNPTSDASSTENDKLSLSRSLALSVLSELSTGNNVGAIAIGAASSNASQNVRVSGGSASLVQWDYIGGQNIGKVSPLGAKEQALRDAIARVEGGGQAASEYWIAASTRALDAASGSKNIIVITDGQSCKQNCHAAGGGSDEEATISLAANVAKQGGKVYVVGIRAGPNELFMQQLAEAGNGIYFPASDKNKLRILFGDAKEATGAEGYALVVLNANHFITRNVPLQGTVYGYNQVVPKNYASMLVTAGNGQPVLTVWNYGVGRVASLTAYNGNDYGELLARGNSLLISRTGNWVVGDPERKQDSIVTVPHMYAGRQATITVESDKIPVNDALRFTPKGRSPQGKTLFEASYTPSVLGFGDAGGVPFATSYPAEYERVGMNPGLEPILEVSSGKLFDPRNADGIIEHAQTIRQLQERTVEPLRFPFLILAAVLFLIEIAVRRLYEVLRNRSL